MHSTPIPIIFLCSSFHSYFHRLPIIIHHNLSTKNRCDQLTTERSHANLSDCKTGLKSYCSFENDIHAPWGSCTNHVQMKSGPGINGTVSLVLLRGRRLYYLVSLWLNGIKWSNNEKPFDRLIKTCPMHVNRLEIDINFSWNSQNFRFCCFCCKPRQTFMDHHSLH